MRAVAMQELNRQKWTAPLAALAVAAVLGLAASVPLWGRDRVLDRAASWDDTPLAVSD